MEHITETAAQAILTATDEIVHKAVMQYQEGAITREELHNYISNRIVECCETAIVSLDTTR